MYSAGMVPGVEVGRLHGFDTAMADFASMCVRSRPPDVKVELHWLPRKTLGMH
jgi:hypothetical protein